MTALHTDVLIIGAGLSAIDVAYRIQEQCPELDYVLLEARDRMGGTWDLFRYPGVRSDSDIYTLAFPFRPWRGKNSIVDGDELLAYLEDTARETGIDQHVRLRTRVTAAAWDSTHGQWTVTCETEAGTVRYTARFLVSCAGYYDLERPHDPGFEGLDDFRGELVHPQFWSADLDVVDKHVVVIGSGATAVTLVPALVREGARVTMLQRTPSYVLAQPRTDPVADLARRVLPAGAAHRAVRAKNTGVQWALVQACLRFPRRMRALLRKGVVAHTGAQIADEHFTPPYDPWEQRLCIAPEGDLLSVVGDGSAAVVTDRVERFVADGVALRSGRTLDADVVVTATGLAIRLIGGVRLEVDGEPVDLSQTYAYHGAMLSGVPNFAVCIGYINLSWTVRADVTARLVARVLRRRIDTGDDVVVPVAPPGLGPGRPFMDMQSGYLARAADAMPRTTATYPWAFRQNVLIDSRATNRADLDDGLVWSRSGAGAQDMRAVELHGGRLATVTRPVPRPAKGQVLLRVLRTGICGSDLHAQVHADASADIAAEVGYDDFMRPHHHVVLGHEFVGEVVAYGPGCRRRWPAGTRVVTLPLTVVDGQIQMTGLSERAPGGYAQYVLAWEDATIEVPDGVPAELAALTEPLAVALHAVRRGHTRRGDTAVVIGCGPIGLAVILMLKAAGVRRVVASDYSAGRRELARRCGAEVVDPAVESPWDRIAGSFTTRTTDYFTTALRALHGLRRVDAVPWPTVLRTAQRAGLGPRGPVVFECVGTPGVIEQIVTAAPFLSRVVVVGVCMVPDTFRPTMASNKEIELLFSFCYDPAEFHRTLQMIAKRTIDPSPLVTGVVGLDGVPGAFDVLREAQQHAKIVIDPSL